MLFATLIGGSHMFVNRKSSKNHQVEQVNRRLLQIQDTERQLQLEKGQLEQEKKLLQSVSSNT
jgi:hypothetical protein